MVHDIHDRNLPLEASEQFYKALSLHENHFHKL